MAHVHIALIGGQLAPNYNTLIFDTNNRKVDKVILICSDQTKNEAEQMKENFSDIVSNIELLKCSTTDLIEINTMFNGLYKSFDVTDEIIINIAGGAKIWNLRLQDIFCKREHTQFLMPIQGNVIWDLFGGNKFDLGFDPNLYLTRWYSNLEFGTPLKDYTDNPSDITALNKIESCRKINSYAFSKLTIRDYISDDGKDYFEESSIEWRKADKYDKNDHATIIIKNRFNKIKNDKICSPHALSLLFNSGWFEFKVATILKQWKMAKDIWLNSKIKSQTNNDLNEIDVIVNTGSKLLFVECKVSVFNTTDIDKFNSVCKAYGGGSTKSLFIVYDTLRENSIGQNAIEKCNNHHILSFSLRDNNYDYNKLLNTLDLYMLSTNK